MRQSLEGLLDSLRRVQAMREVEMYRFRAGDHVRCINASAGHGLLSQGTSYKVQAAREFGVVYQISVWYPQNPEVSRVISPHWFDSSAFEFDLIGS
jgi:hypothetical protein